MSDARWQFDVSPTTAEAYEAMVIVGRGLLTRRTKTLVFVHSIFNGLLAPLGAVLVFWSFVVMVVGNDNSALRGATLPITLLIFGGIGIWLTRKAHLVMAEASVKSHFGRQYHVSLDSSGITVTTDNSRWHSGWMMCLWCEAVNRFLQLVYLVKLLQCHAACSWGLMTRQMRCTLCKHGKRVHNEQF